MKLQLHIPRQAVQQALAKAEKQARYAAAVALTRVAYQGQRETPDYLDKALDRPTPFTKRGVYVERATPAKLEAVVGFKPVQAQYLRLQEEGGIRPPKARSIALPTAIKLNQFGSIGISELRRLYERAKRGRKATASLKRKLGVSTRVELFVGEPGHGLPPGIYKRVPKALVPLVVFRREPVRYRPRMGWKRWAMSQARDRVAGEFARTFAQAMASAR
jgi:hypothetical protein